ncbi:MAG: S41 family peptidase [Pseudomonadota bacterium]
MKRLLLAMSAACALALGGTSAAAPKPYAPLFEEVWGTVGRELYDPHFAGQDWNALGARYRSRLGEAKDDATFARLANAMLAELRLSHLYLNMPDASRAAGSTGIGAEVEEVAGERVVVEVAPLSAAQRAGVRVGDRIRNPKALVGALGAETALEVVGCDGAVRTVTTRHERAAWPPARPAFSWRQVTPRKGVTLGYIRIDRFDDGAAGFADLAMDDLKDTQGVVIDVRRNSGGNLSALRLASYFIDGSRPAVALVIRPYLQGLGRPFSAADMAALAPVRGAYTDAGVFEAIEAGKGAAAYWSEDLGAKRYRGKVVVVTSAATGSAGEGFAAMMRDLANAPSVGQPTAGYILSSERYKLSDGWVLTIPTSGVWGPDARDYGDKPVPPTVAVPRAAADYCRADDPDLAAAVDLLERELAGAN